MAFFSNNGEKILNLPEQVEKNAEDIAANKEDVEKLKTKTSSIENDTQNIAGTGDGTSMFGTLDVEGKLTAQSDMEVDGKLIVNSADDITDKDGNAIVKNESLEEFKKLYYAEAGIGKYAGIALPPNTKDWKLKDIKNFTNLDLLFSGATIYIQYGNDSFTMCDIGIAETSHMFYRAKGVRSESQDQGWKIIMGNGTTKAADWMFVQIENIKSIIVAEGSNFFVKNSAYYMFAENPKLEEIGAFDMSMTTELTIAFIRDISLKHIHIKHFKVSFNISDSTAFEQSDLVEIISNLDPVSTPQTLTMGATNLAKLTQDQILVATGKGWTLA